MPPKKYSPGDTVFAKLRGYPWWPARVEDDKELPAKILKQKGKSKAAFHTVFFYGSRDYGFFGPDCIRPFDRAAVERDLKAKKFKTKDLQHAIRQALDPALLKAEEEAEAAELEEASEEDAEEEAEAAELEEASGEDAEEEEEQEEMGEDEDELAEEEEDTKPKKKERKKATAKKPIVRDDSSKRTRSDDGSETDSKRSRTSLSMEQEEDTGMRKGSPSILRKSEEPENTVTDAAYVEKFKRTPEYKKTYYWRHKLQRLIYEKRPGEIPKDDYQRISKVLKEVEDINMTFDLLRYTKIGKVVKYGCGYTFKNDEHDIKNRCVSLLRKWKSMLTPQAIEQQKDPENSKGHHHS